MSLAEYLAKNYLTKDPSKQRKKRKKDKERERGITIADDDATGWGGGAGDEHEGRKGMEIDEGVLIVRDGHSADFRKKKFSSWIATPSATAEGGVNDDDHGAAEAAAILAQATLERAAQVEEEATDADVAAAAAAARDVIRLESGAHAGLQTASQVAAAVAKKRAEDMAALRSLRSSEGAAAAAKSQETIYRDASGRVVNIAMARAEARRVADEARAKEAADALQRAGEVQLRQAADAKQELEDARFKTLARYRDDAELNEELKAKERWEDPALAFLSAKKPRTAGRLPQKTYQGPFQPNRYGIRPGWRWDGVDRGNGFEKKWFEARATKESKRNLEYQWELDE